MHARHRLVEDLREISGFVLPFANARHAHEYKCFADYPLADDQILVAGVIDPLTNIIEHPEVVADRIERVAAVIGDPTRVLAGTDCGFAQGPFHRRVHPSIMWAKLEAMAQGAATLADLAGLPGDFLPRRPRSCRI